jgi:hypothetical protein
MPKQKADIWLELYRDAFMYLETGHDELADVAHKSAMAADLGLAEFSSRFTRSNSSDEWKPRPPKKRDDDHPAPEIDEPIDINTTDDVEQPD